MVSRNGSSSRSGGSTSKGGIVSLNTPPIALPSSFRMATDCSSTSSFTPMAPMGLVGSVSARRRTIQYMCVAVSHEPNGTEPNRSVWRASMSPRGWVLGRPEVAGLRFAVGERVAYHPHHLQELMHRQLRGEYRSVPAAVGFGLREI